MIALARTTTNKHTAENHTGYAQVIEEWDPDGTPTLKMSYVVGHDQIPKKPGPKLKQKVNN